MERGDVTPGAGTHEITPEGRKDSGHLLVYTSDRCALEILSTGTYMYLISCSSSDFVICIGSDTAPIATPPRAKKKLARTLLAKLTRSSEPS